MPLLHQHQTPAIDAEFRNVYREIAEVRSRRAGTSEPTDPGPGQPQAPGEIRWFSANISLRGTGAGVVLPRIFEIPLAMPAGPYTPLTLGLHVVGRWPVERLGRGAFQVTGSQPSVKPMQGSGDYVMQGPMYYWIWQWDEEEPYEYTGGGWGPGQPINTLEGDTVLLTAVLWADEGEHFRYLAFLWGSYLEHDPAIFTV